MNPEVGFFFGGIFFYTGLILVFIAIVYHFGKKRSKSQIKREPGDREAMIESHIKEEPEDKEKMLESHLEREPEEREERFDVKYKELLTASLVCGIIAGIFAGFFIWGFVDFVLAIPGGVGAVYLLKSSANIKGKLRMGKAGLAGGLTGVIMKLVSFPMEYLFWRRFSLPHLDFVVTFMAILFVLGVLGAVMANEKVL